VGQHRLEVGMLGLGGAQLADPAGHLLKLRIFGGELDIGVRVRARGHAGLDELEAFQDLVHPVARQFDHAESVTGARVRSRAGMRYRGMSFSAAKAASMPRTSFSQVGAL